MLGFLRKKMFTILEWTLLVFMLLVVANDYIWTRQDMKDIQESSSRQSMVQSLVHDAWTIGLLAVLLACFFGLDLVRRRRRAKEQISLD